MIRNKRKLMKKRAVFVCSIALIVILGTCIIQRNYNKKNVVRANRVIKNTKKNIVKKANIKDNSNLYDCNIDANAPGAVYPWSMEKGSPKKIAYLTFDDGPSINTAKILNILNENNIHATFFLIGKNAEEYPSLAKLEVTDGETVANHTYSHVLNYKEQPKQFVEDINRCDLILKGILGDKYIPKFVRFPGGSFGNKLQPFKDAVAGEGYRYLDWNALNGDAERPNVPVDQLIDNVKKTVEGKKVVVILMHDAGAKTTTVQALPQIIQYLKSQGFSFGKLV
ncbi:peptidoglycan/xylan/chitin deacetylase (PgdA/CDA1 family) [Clostridium acetobutylicum]|uniref:Predicted xylanase/chitin deacetylase n=1 Tax=Clostridium acetobutylicum (strain ATCC 824 / DSM 792 / JCM 1419 / IAM 19013 / LMG 5710 / NBRC 13948 / NRRL B-527 / VKM B-1787 / 2291 / W) TaxID=272562 RepID=Q97GH1_CLOAB|nr:polysaccharide deacetylase family protein [Clostridium acetobutylicum]PSM07188.1 polysaccharide deacetylase [Clostridium sp. NJ4]AAK80351.1 Predicted xylanase/chitin deacetylase [Clostridium acetobutylicum ATCC 824]ADZ21448.1 xylanase/chitin deacetylase [Clostridium acetobutylicum EA 2018]AEI32316.1 xylanase/chitin deacetylase [Clostridium acetobutylicum DSM 1731]AWV79228.1 polysaccharide deacetylase [Clostridium acetobutylicum]